MKKLLSSLFLFSACLLSACSPLGEKTGSATFIYGVMTVFAALFLVGYCVLIKEKNGWFLVLFASIVLVNGAYFALSVSSTLSEALWANRAAYLASVCLPLSTIMIVLKIGAFRYPKWLPFAMGGVCLAVFLVAASQGFCRLYYSEVSLVTQDGVATLEKVYGPLHSLYLYFLLAAFGTIIVCTSLVFARRRLERRTHCVMLACAVFLNLMVWLFEQIVRFDFEFLSVSYVISELFLLIFCLLVQEQERILQNVRAEVQTSAKTQTSTAASRFESLLPTLTRTERAVYDLYVSGKRSREIMQILSITENTLKYHNKNIYAKLGISSRKQLLGEETKGENGVQK